MKKIIIYRGDNPQPFVLANGDIYDSTLVLSEVETDIFNKTEEKTLFYTGYVNTDHTTGYRGGILAEGEYLGICGVRQNKRKEKAIWLYNKRYGIVDQKEFLPDEAFILPSLVPNPNHNGKKIIQYVLIHRGGLSWDFSQGCITIMGGNFDEFIKYFKVGECALVILKRGAFYKFPA
ncbi:hypothetical protein [Thermospira aquatica]|uniref:YkuD domain-containing protein n=1 Tax=Thermospira aquatica TaxID=2828656 RepID=A0AAX3BDX3_9SPIR|nr:hypothetical protein [Thermospira aquatica]URA10543.1 hypothetical protein KDW03_01705 [Thermospira aquatica]